jgi:hypothetical protein
MMEFLGHPIPKSETRVMESSHETNRLRDMFPISSMAPIRLSYDRVISKHGYRCQSVIQPESAFTDPR